MKCWFRVLILVGGLGACGERPDASTPKGAFALLSPCMDRGDAGCLFRQLDRDSRWAVQTIHKTLGQMKRIVDASYPESERSHAFGAWGEEARAETPDGMFRVFCQKRQCLSRIAAGFSAVKQVSSNGENRATVTTLRGAAFEMAAFDGQWGLAVYQKELLAAKLRFIDSLKQVERNAKAFEEQRAASDNIEQPL
jgi:hypothetical protein